jgi:hypothetical protein
MRAPKSGFGIPLNDWFQEPAFRALTERLQDPGHPAAPFFQARALDRILKESASGGDHGEALWLITNVFLWTEIWSGDSWRTPPRFESDDTAPSGISPRAA